MTREEFGELLDRQNLPELNFGCFTMSFCDARSLDDCQEGYAVYDFTDDDSAADLDGEWRRSWCVFGQSFRCDPIFVDLATDESPVLTAEHGAGRWDPKAIAPGLEEFVHLVRRLEPLCMGREYPVALEDNPLPESDLADFISEIRRNGADEAFWTEAIM